MNEEIIEFLDHSNRIENVYSMDALGAAVEAWIYLESKKTLTKDTILKTHKLLLKPFFEAERFAGKLRDCNVTVGGRELPDYHDIPPLFSAWLRKWGKVTEEKDIKKAHVIFEKVHPFEDGNGRMGRVIINWQRIKAGLPILIIHEGDEQKEYYKWFE